MKNNDYSSEFKFFFVCHCTASLPIINKTIFELSNVHTRTDFQSIIFVHILSQREIKHKKQKFSMGF